MRGLCKDQRYTCMVGCTGHAACLRGASPLTPVPIDASLLRIAEALERIENTLVLLHQTKNPIVTISGTTSKAST